MKEKKGSKGAKKPIKEEEPINLDIKTTKDVVIPVFNETNRALGRILYAS